MIARFLPGIVVEHLLKVLGDWKGIRTGDYKNSDIFSSTDRKVIFVNSGRSALYLALKGIGVRTGDEIIIPALTCPAVVDAIISSGATPVVLPVETGSFGLDPLTLGEAINSRTKAIIPTDIYGTRCRISDIAEINDGRAVIIEDSAQVSPVELISWNRRHSDAYIMSLNFDKHITVGGGGILILNRPGLFSLPPIDRSIWQDVDDLFGAGLQRLLMDRAVYDGFLPMTAGREMVSDGFISREKVFNLLRSYVENNDYGDEQRDELSKLADRYSEQRSGSRLANLIRRGLWGLIRPVFPPKPEALGRVSEMGNLKRGLFNMSIKYFENDRKLRQRLAERYYMGLKDVEGIWVQRWQGDVLLRFSVSLSDRKKARVLAKRLASVDVEAGPFNYPAPIHRIPTYRNYIRVVGKMNETERLIEGLINLPLHSQVCEDEVDRIVAVVRGVATERG